MAGIYMVTENRTACAAGCILKNSREPRKPSRVFMKELVACIVTSLFFLQSFSQDLHFSQWFNSPLTTNPANTGFIPDADYRLGANYRNQWSSIMSLPFKTMSVWGDAQFLRDRIETGWLGVGGLILRDVAGSGSLTSTKVYGSIA